MQAHEQRAVLQVHFEPRERKLASVFHLFLALVIDERLVAQLAELVAEPIAHHVVPQLVGAFLAGCQVLACAQLHQHAHGVLRRSVLACGGVRAHQRRAHVGVAAADLQAQIFGIHALVQVQYQRHRRPWLCHVLYP